MTFENDKAKTVYISILRKMTPIEKLKKAFELSDFTKKLFYQGLKMRHPELNDRELKELFLKELKKCSNSNY